MIITAMMMIWVGYFQHFLGKTKWLDLQNHGYNILSHGKYRNLSSRLPSMNIYTDIRLTNFSGSEKALKENMHFHPSQAQNSKNESTNINLFNWTTRMAALGDFKHSS